MVLSWGIVLFLQRWAGRAAMRFVPQKLGKNGNGFKNSAQDI